MWAHWANASRSEELASGLAILCDAARGCTSRIGRGAASSLIMSAACSETLSRVSWNAAAGGVLRAIDGLLGKSCG